MKAAVEIANNEFSKNKFRTSPVCTLMHKDLTALEVKYLVSDYGIVRELKITLLAFSGAKHY